MSGVMRKFTYPAVLFFDEEEKNYIIAMFDLGLVTSGETVEEAHTNARTMLDSYLFFNLLCLIIDIFPEN